jgi:hypothetical protein
VPVGAVIVIVPVATAHVGWIKVVIGVAGLTGCLLIVTLVSEEIQLSEFFMVTMYVHAGNRVNIPVVLVKAVPSIVTI